MAPDATTPVAPDAAGRKEARLFLVACFLGWCALLTVTASSIAIVQFLPFLFTLQMALCIWGPYAVAAPAVVRMAQRLPLSKAAWRTNIWMHLVAGLLFVAVCEGSFVGLIRLLQPQAAALLAQRQQQGENRVRVDDPLVALSRSREADAAFPKDTLRLAVFKMQFSLPLYWVLVGVAHAMGARTELRERERQAAQLAAHLTQAQLAGLRTQLQPHFLFNTLNSIAALIPQDAKLATEMIMNLSDLLRMTLREPQRGEIQLREELALLQHYVDIQRLRFGERLAFHVEAGEEALRSPVPPLLLQPLVENAIRHGVEASDQTEHVTVRGCLERDELVLEVANTCNAAPDESRPPTQSTGLGLANTQARLQVQFGDRQHFQAGPMADGGFRVTMRIPARPSVAHPSHDEA